MDSDSVALFLFVQGRDLVDGIVERLEIQLRVASVHRHRRMSGELGTDFLGNAYDDINSNSRGYKKGVTRLAQKEQSAG